MLGVASGRSVTRSPPLSVKLYISFCTMSVDSPVPLAKSSSCSMIGVRTSTYPYRSHQSRAVRSTSCHFSTSPGRMSRVPRMAEVMPGRRPFLPPSLIVPLQPHVVLRILPNRHHIGVAEHASDLAGAAHDERAGRDDRALWNQCAGGDDRFLVNDRAVQDDRAHADE